MSKTLVFWGVLLDWHIIFQISSFWLLWWVINNSPLHRLSLKECGRRKNEPQREKDEKTNICRWNQSIKKTVKNLSFCSEKEVIYPKLSGKGLQEIINLCIIKHSLKIDKMEVEKSISWSKNKSIAKNCALILTKWTLSGWKKPITTQYFSVL